MFLGVQGVSPGASPPFGIRQGTIVTWDVLSGENTISVAGAVLTNVPFMTPGTFFILQAGDPVILLTMRGSWFILGRTVNPGGVQGVGRFTALPVGLNSGTVSNYSLSTTLVTKVSLTVNVPSWAEVCTVDVSLHALAQNNSGASDFLQVGLGLNGGTQAINTSATVPTATYGSTGVRYSNQVFVTPGGTLTIDAQLRAIGGAWAANASNFAFFNGFAIWNSDLGG
jgi:hypothetical protein